MTQRTQITPVVFPLNLGTATFLNVSVKISNDNTSGPVFYALYDMSNDITRRRLTHGVFRLTEEQVTANGNDVNWATNYVVEQLGLTLAS